MATVKMSISTILIIGSALMMLSSCKKDDTTSPADKVTFATGDIEGVWSGALRVAFHGGYADGMDTTMAMKMTFGPNGTFISIDQGAAYMSILGHVSVAADGKITGIIITTHKTDSVNVETTNMNWTGSAFETKTKINVGMIWPWTNTGYGTGYYLITGILNKQ